MPAKVTVEHDPKLATQCPFQRVEDIEDWSTKRCQEREGHAGKHVDVHGNVCGLWGRDLDWQDA